MKTICCSIVFVSLLMGIALLAFAEEIQHTPLLEENEKVLVSFAMEGSSKILTVATSEDGSYIIYRFGRENQVELEFPNMQEDSWDKFTHKEHFREVGEERFALEISYLEFANYGYTYRVYDAYTAEFDKAFVGVMVIENDTGKQYDIQALPDSKVGSISNLNTFKMIEARAAF